ncbi:MAG: hypothetical protein IKY79_00285 [Bacteroidales bacterium]|nr:hypothetical protein [Bacteroidales bacterium]
MKIDFTKRIEEYKDKSDKEIMSYLSDFWNVIPNEDGIIRLYASYQKSEHKDNKGNDFAFFIDVRNEVGDILYYPYRLGKVKIWSQYKTSFESQPIWKINVRLNEKKYRKDNPFALCMANNTVGKPSLKFNERLDNESYVKKLFYDTGSTEKDAKTIVNALHNIMDDLYTNADDRFVYELIQNADDQPLDGKNVSVNMQLLNRHLLFMHNGRPFDKEDIYSICDIGSSTKRNSKEKIGYKGIGFKSVFTGSDTVIVNSGNYSFAFDKDSPIYNGVIVENIPWQLKPIWQEKYRCPQEIRINECFWKSPVGISLEINESNERHYDNSIRKILSNPLFLLFLKNVDSVRYQHDYNDFVVSKKTSDNIVHITQNGEIISSWTTFDFVVEIPQDIRDAMQNDRNVPQKMKEAKKTQISFAALITDGQIKQLDNSVLYAYLPTSVNDFKFNFIVNADFLLAANREQLHTKKIWNQFLFQQIGKLLIDWGKSVSAHIPTYLKVFPTIKLPEEEAGHLALSSYFNSSYKSALESEAFILNHKGELAKQDEIIIDKTGLAEIVGADLFCQLLQTEKCLPSEKIDSKILEEDIFEKIDLMKFDTIIDIITNNEEFNEWFVSADEEYKNLLYKWINKQDVSSDRNTKLKKLVSNLPLFQFDNECLSISQIANNVDYIITTDKIELIKVVLLDLGYHISDNRVDDHLLLDYIDLQNEKKLFDDIAKRISEKDIDLSPGGKLLLIEYLLKFDDVGPESIAKLKLFLNMQGEKKALSEMLVYRDNVPKWLEKYVICKNEYFDELVKYLIPKEREFEEIVWKHKTEFGISETELYEEYQWTDEKYTQQLILQYRNSDNYDQILPIIERSSENTKKLYLQNLNRMDLIVGEDKKYKKDSHEYRILQMALNVLDEPSNFSSKIYFEEKCIKEFSVSDDVVCEYIQNGETKKVKMSLAKLLPQCQNQSDLIEKIKALFENKKDLGKFFVAKLMPQNQIIKHLESPDFLNLKPGEWPNDKNGNAYQYLFYVYYYRQVKNYNSSWVISINLEEESDSFVSELMNFLCDNKIDISSSPFTYRLKNYFNNKYFDYNYLFEREQLLSTIERWADGDEKIKYLKDNGVQSSNCNAMQFRKLFLEDKSIDFIEELTDVDLSSGVEFIATVDGFDRPFTGTNQGILLKLKDKKCCNLFDNWNNKKIEENSKEWNTKEYKEWIEKHYPNIFIYSGILPRQLSYKSEILLNYDDPKYDYYYNSQEKKLFVSNVKKIEDILFEVAKEGKSDFAFDDYKKLCLEGKMTISNEDIEKKDKTIETLEESNRKKDEIIKKLQEKLKMYENDESCSESKQKPNSILPKIEVGVLGGIGDRPQWDAQIEAQKRLIQEFPQWIFPSDYGEADENGKPYNFSTIEIEDENDKTIPIVLKSYKKTSEPFKINTEEWNYLIREQAILLIYTGADIKRVYVRDLIRKQSSIAISFSTENLDLEDKVNAFADSLHYFNELHFDFDSFNISSRAQSAAELYTRNKRAFFANDNTEDDI